jgi:hypothetical protein
MAFGHIRPTLLIQPKFLQHKHNILVTIYLAGCSNSPTRLNNA